MMRYKISDLAQLLNVSTNTVRRYEQMGYIHAQRDESNGYRYYSEEDIFRFINARLMRKYGFTHDDLAQMKCFDITKTMEAYEKRMEKMDEEIAYMTYVRHRIKDDALLMKKYISINSVYEKWNVPMFYVLE
jgi:DNA-binding transcriptional MerR regulator